MAYHNCSAPACLVPQAEIVWQSSPFMLDRYGLSWWPLQLPALRAIFGSPEYQMFEEEVRKLLPQVFCKLSFEQQPRSSVTIHFFTITLVCRHWTMWSYVLF